jgi:hypothetical protein
MYVQELKGASSESAAIAKAYERAVDAVGHVTAARIRTPHVTHARDKHVTST